MNRTGFPVWATPKFLRPSPTGTHPLLCLTPCSLQAGRTPIHPVPALSLPEASLLRLRAASLRNSPSLSCFPPAELKAKEHSCRGGALRMCLWEKAGGTGVMRKEVHQPALGSQNVFSWLQLSPFYSQSVLHSSHTHHSQRNCSKAHWCF